MASRPTRLKVKVTTAATCSSMKVGLPTKEAALEVAEEMMTAGKVYPGCHITPYECDECGEWHVRNKVIVPVGRWWRKRGEPGQGGSL